VSNEPKDPKEPKGPAPIDLNRIDDLLSELGGDEEIQSEAVPEPGESVKDGEAAEDDGFELDVEEEPATPVDSPPESGSELQLVGTTVDADYIHRVVGVLRERVKTSEAEVERLETELEKFKQELARSTNNMAALRRRNQQEREELGRYGAEGLVKDLLEVIDNLERALEAVPDSEEAQSWSEGVRITYQAFLRVLHRHGIEVVTAAKGDPFDPKVHEAFARTPLPGVPAGSVGELLHKGYLLHERLLRATGVVVSAGDPGEVTEISGADTEAPKPGDDGPEPSPQEDGGSQDTSGAKGAPE
jgi:molecular chaperone GrpE